MATKKSEFPPGWDAARVQDLVDYYDRQTDEDAAAEHEAALLRPDHTLIEIPTDLLPAVRKTIADHCGRFSASGTPNTCGKSTR